MVSQFLRGETDRQTKQYPHRSQWRRHGVDMSTTLLPEVIPEIGENSMTLLEARIGEGESC